MGKLTSYCCVAAMAFLPYFTIHDILWIAKRQQTFEDYVLVFWIIVLPFDRILISISHSHFATFNMYLGKVLFQFLLWYILKLTFWTSYLRLWSFKLPLKLHTYLFNTHSEWHPLCPLQMVQPICLMPTCILIDS